MLLGQNIFFFGKDVHRSLQRPSWIKKEKNLKKSVGHEEQEIEGSTRQEILTW